MEKFMEYGKTRVRINNETPKDGLYRTTSRIVFEILNGIIQAEYSIDRFEQNDGKVLEVARHRLWGIREGCPVWIDGKPAPDGQYERGLFVSCKVNEGKIVSN
jgi:hypothetical protein